MSALEARFYLEERNNAGSYGRLGNRGVGNQRLLASRCLVETIEMYRVPICYEIAVHCGLHKTVVTLEFFVEEWHRRDPSTVEGFWCRWVDRAAEAILGIGSPFEGCRSPSYILVITVISVAIGHRRQEERRSVDKEVEPTQRPPLIGNQSNKRRGRTDGQTDIRGAEKPKRHRLDTQSQTATSCIARGHNYVESRNGGGEEEEEEEEEEEKEEEEEEEGKSWSRSEGPHN
ncbi:hypothetical protein WH47_08821 [Habropoda laboriosa]|uniref:Uncharacterized protein n=1 Tax=Habropoda laboriosa TaxID=597456 RepID=A0A0L7R6F3_9HYME|nr:hypothetical protein WH47_08821 [Habropoda laboriosa]